MPDPLISTQDVVNYLGRGDASDPVVTIAVDAASDIVRTLTEQTFNATTGGTVTLDGTGTDALLLPQLPISNAGTVTVDGSAVTDYLLRDDGALLRTDGTATTLSWPQGRQNVEVVYDCGYADADIPRDVRMVALAIASRIYLQGPMMQESIGQVSTRYAVASTDLTNGEKAILRKHRPR